MVPPDRHGADKVCFPFFSFGLWGFLALVLLSLLFLEDGEPRRNMACVFSFFPFFYFTQINIGLEMG